MTKYLLSGDIIPFAFWERVLPIWFLIFGISFLASVAFLICLAKGFKKDLMFRLNLASVVISFITFYITGFSIGSYFGFLGIVQLVIALYFRRK
ncbi:hypothetical protein [Bacillus sp. es.036]|uniref:hypothetical protein n=1 Tax=Bacillus sp. es.036 TaxID=1761764 RepID=UPI000BF8097E|nr:hypothetical protein [Bacillus sp. es.036]